ncbi:MAG: ABC transporter ATP-binding protein [Rhodospirillales bacterium]|nr:ABC transporter ATP-binding protein [Rhodospirillales bacterium]
MSSLLEVENLGTWFYTRQGIVRAVDGVDFQVASGETLAIVGESGCGKSMTALSLMRLIPDPPGRIVSGSIRLGDRDLLKISEEEMRRVGMRQRAMIAMALACNPKVLIADEPTTALDVTIQAQILELIVELQREFGAAVILITHDLGVVAETARRVIVMYAGRKVEEAEVGELFAKPLHPYTVGLLASIPRLDLMRGEAAARNTASRLQEIPGIVPPLFDLPEGCAFAPRCNKADDQCRRERPTYEQKRTGHWAACWHSDV